MFSLLYGLMISSAVAETPKDILYIDTTSKVIQNYYKDSNDAGEKALKEAFFSMVEYQIKRTTKEKNIVSIVSVDDPIFQMFLNRQVTKIVDNALAGQTAVERLNALQNILRVLSTEDTAHTLINTYLSLPKNGTLITEYKPKRVPYFKDQVSLKSTDSRLRISINPESTVTDFGGPGGGNGILDSGEWVKYSVDVENVSDRPFFSSSLYLDRTGRCSWTFPQSEIELPELLKNEKKGFSVWVYLSRDCYNQERSEVNFRVVDSQRTDRSGISLSTTLVVTNRGRHAMNTLSWDTDEPGSSERTSTPKIQPEQHIELSHGVSTTSKAKIGKQNWGVQKYTAKFLDMTFNVNAPMYPSNTRILPGDDVDIVIKSEGQYLNAFNSLVKDKSWKRPEDAKAIFVSDTEVLYDHPFEKYQPTIVVPKEICSNYLDDDNDGKHDCQDSDCKDAAVCQEGPEPVPVKDVITLFGMNADLVASNAKKTRADSVTAVQPHFELTFDVSTFTKQYECLVKDVPLSECGVIVCPTCEEPPIVAPVEKNPSKPEYVSYHVRNYVIKNLSIPTEQCNDSLDNDLDGKSDCKDPDCLNSPYCTEIVQDEVCDNGIDDDKDGRRDCSDSDCSDHPACQVPDEVCDNGIDDDKDGRRDCSDSDCSDHPACQVPDEVCDNGIDDDKDGDTDCEDWDCPDCAKRIEKSRLAVGFERTSLSTENNDFIVWKDTDNVQKMSPIQFKYSYMIGNRIPLELFYNSTGKQNDVLESSFFGLWTAGAGIGYSHPVTNSLRLAAVLRGGFREIYIQSPEFADNFDRTFTLLPTASVQWNITPMFDLYFEAGGQITPAQIEYSFGSVVINDGMRVGSGFGVSF